MNESSADAIREGYVVVQIPLGSGEAPFNRRYRGIDRLVPWTMENFERGFDDPYESSEYADEDGIIRSLSLALDVRLVFTEIVPIAELEILFVRQVLNGSGEAPLSADGTTFLGFDVAGNASPFYSIVSDFPSPAESTHQAFASKLNENGLFDKLPVAAAYFADRLQQRAEYRNQGMVVWQVSVVSNASIAGAKG